MAKNFVKPRKHETGRLITTKTPFGTTSDMIVTEEEILNKVKVEDDCVLVKDDDGYYITYKNRVNNGLADSMRYDISHREKVEKRINLQLEGK